MKNLIKLVLILLFISISIYSQDKGAFVERKSGFYVNEILKGIKEFEQKDKPERKFFQVDLTSYDLPKSVDEFTSQWHNEPVSQGNTGTCWSYSTTSFFESEIFRLTGKKIKLSEMYTVYFEYIEKALGYIHSKGETIFEEGSEANAVTKIWRKYGIVPISVYDGMLPGQKFHNHSKMHKDMKNYLETVKKHSMWNESVVMETIISILDSYMGKPPVSFEFEGKDYTPLQFMSEVIKVNPDDYVDILSLLQKPYFTKVDYPVPDNWWKNSDYHNVPLDEFINTLKKAVREGYTVSIGGDVSEAGKVTELDVFVVPTFDIPSEYIDENSRQFRFSNGTTTDDHGIHLVGYLEKDGKDWFLIKDSGASARDGNNFGYYFFHEDYVKLKMMDFMIHKDAVSDLMKKFE